jgi:uncharacterized membrane protein
MIIGLGVFISALLLKNNDLKRTGLIIFVFIALIAIPTFATGTAAELALQKKPDISQTAIEAHETAAFIALCVMEVTGALSWLGLWQYRRAARLRQGTIAAVLIAGLATFGLMARAANMGGEIRHPEIRDAGAVQAAPANPPLARVIGDGMVNLKWGWPASETVHFIGLSLLVGVVLLVDLRMLGFLKSIPYSTLHRLLPWGMLGFAVNVLTGMLFFIGAPPDFYMSNGVFVWKLAFIVVAGANALYFTVFEQAWTIDAGDNPPMTAKVAALTGLAAWFGVLFCGQMLPFLGHSF